MFYHRFIRQAAHVMRPLYGALKDKSPNQAVDWTAEREKAFEATKAALGKAAMLAHPSYDAPIAITTDASDYAVGAVHEQWVDGAWQPLAFFSRQLTPRERKYSAFDRELLGLLAGDPPFPVPPGRTRVRGFHGPQASDILHVQGGGAVVCPAAASACVHL